MKKLLVSLIIIGFIAVSANAAPWAHRYDNTVDGQIWETTNVVQNSILRVAVEWGEGDWDGAMGSAFGMGSSTNGY